MKLLTYNCCCEKAPKEGVFICKSCSEDLEIYRTMNQPRIDVLNHGFVRLVDHCGSDLSIVRAARVSYNAEWRTGEDEGRDAKLIDYLVKNKHCVTPDTLILTEDLRWVPAGDLKVGDPLIGFDEDAGSYTSQERKWRSYQKCEVTSTGTKVEDVWKLTFEDGTTVKCTGDHRWIAFMQRQGDTKGGRSMKWERTDELAKNLQTKRVLLPRVAKPWSTDLSYGAGFLAGAWDADGCLSRRTTTSRLQFAQYNNPLLHRVEAELTARGFASSLKWSDIRSKHQTKPMATLSVVGGHPETLRFLGTVRPPRIMGVWAEETIIGRKVLADEYVRVVSIERIGEMPITLLGTSTETYIAEGFLAHNTSPLEMVQFTFEVKAPIFVFRQWHRHRMWSYNEVSARYSELPEEYYIPEVSQITTQHTSNKQMRSDDIHPEAEMYQELISASCADAFKVYKHMIAKGVPRELARGVLPMNTFSHMFASVDLHNLTHFLRLRLHSHAQYEIRVYAQAMLELIEPIVPVAVAALKRHQLGDLHV